MRLPPELLAAIQQETGRIERRNLAQSAAQLSEHYKAADFSTAAVTNEAQRAAYLAVRMPATYAAIRRVLAEIPFHIPPLEITLPAPQAEIRQRAPAEIQLPAPPSEITLPAPQAEIKSLLDIGAGPGTALFAAAEEFPLQRATLIEVDTEWLALGKRLAAQSPLPAVQSAQWTRQDLRSGFSCSPHDLVVVSYTLGELPPSAADSVLRKAWSCTGKFLVIIEPGTPRGFAAINSARSALIANAARIVAPCPHQSACPMAAAGDWCHFSQRVERTSLHRQLKGGTLGYEDEKFSYVIAVKPEIANGQNSQSYSRIVRHPGKHSGHIQLTLCTPQGLIENRTVARSSKAAYKAARKAEWGDSWPELPDDARCRR
jgi:ribosomal protein RSM22 (predicted rRNA methylase)